MGNKVSGQPQLHVKLNTHKDGTRFVAISRGSYAWMKIKPDEVTKLINDLADLTENGVTK